MTDMRKGMSFFCGVVRERLEASRFKVLVYDKKSRNYSMEWCDLVIMVEGIQESSQQRLRWLNEMYIPYKKRCCTSCQSGIYLYICTLIKRHG